MNYDAYLHAKGLKTFDPYGQNDLLPLERQSPDVDQLEILNRYVVSSEKVYCHICGSKRHNNGFTGFVAGGGAILFGSTCAKGYFCEETLRLAELAFDRREEAAFAEFNVKRLKGTASEMQRWLQRYDGQIKAISESWDILLNQHDSTFEELFHHLSKNNNRLTEEFVEEASEISRAVGRNNKTVSRKVIFAIRNSISIKSIRDFRDHQRVVATLPLRLLEIDDAISRADLVELDQQLRSNFFRSLDEFEKVIRFSVEIFVEPAFSQICQWSDRQRIQKLHKTEVSPRNLAKTLRKKIGDGYELPRPMLREIIATENFLLGEKNPSHSTLITESSQR
ncbi:hypothetical protein LXM94_01400 [Rhizobium sp. TRM95111]|uniref:hypothetical protein n=1 Tax=Rhizobium alarense TaxID=2846851 RepID=UPI001F20EEF1|nr:hypothetical protein [Rhizobium alarense]MCF3638625.1 hypothetical protein [Rhizobium alarense]